MNNGNCSHYCFNEKGSYRCGCRVGYTLQGDGMECEGKLNKQSSEAYWPYLSVAT